MKTCQISSGLPSIDSLPDSCSSLCVDYRQENLDILNDPQIRLLLRRMEQMDLDPLWQDPWSLFHFNTRPLKEEDEDLQNSQNDPKEDLCIMESVFHTPSSVEFLLEDALMEDVYSRLWKHEPDMSIIIEPDSPACPFCTADLADQMVALLAAGHMCK